METVLAVALWLFVVSNVDTLLVVAAFCVDRDYRTAEVFVGYYAGSVVGLAAAVVGAVLVAGWLRSWSFLLGVVPIALGLRGLMTQRSPGDGAALSEDGTDESQFLPGAVGRGVVVLATVIGLSGENLAIYIPFFIGLSAGEFRTVVAVYLLAAAALFPLAVGLARGTVAAGVPPWVDRLLVPIMLVLVGVYILVTGGVVL